VLLGPTGTGKSSLAVGLAQALGGEIVSCDAVQVYRGLDAGTAKPTPEERQLLPHHLLDCADPCEDYSMAAYVRAADAAIAEIAGRGRVPLVVGGTGLYLRGLLRGFIEAPARNAALRDRLRALVRRHGSERLHRWLAHLDPESARRLPARDAQRIVRGLELALSGGAPWSARLREAGTWQDGAERYASLKVGLEMEPEALGQRLDARVERFFAGGLVEEVRTLLRCGVPREANALKAIGYREVLAALDDPAALAAAPEQVRRSTRRYAKRQRTWFRKEPHVIWLEVTDERALAERIVRLWRDTAPSHR
jgi:tRNA dimethylallyltransferase